MQHPIGRHHRRCQSLTARLWALFALTLASALAYLFIPNTPKRAEIAPAPRRPELPPARPQARPSTAPNSFKHRKNEHGDPDDIAGALVRPYLPPLVPRPRVPIGDLLAEPAPEPQAPDDLADLADLADVIRTYLRVRG